MIEENIEKSLCMTYSHFICFIKKKRFFSLLEEK